MKQKLCRIFCSCYPQFRMGMERFESLILGENSRVITHCGQGEPLGFAVTEGAALRLICVEPGSQRRGIGSLLLEKAGLVKIIAPDDIGDLKTLTQDHASLEMLYRKAYADAAAIPAFL